MNFKNLIKLIVAIAVSELAGVFGIIFTVSAIPGWYTTLIKSSLTPPNLIFGPIWMIFYVIMGVAVFLVWRKGLNHRGVKPALTAFIAQLILNAGWSFVFFGLHKPLWSLIEIAALWLSIVLTMFLFYRVSKVATYLLVPYILWVSFASYLNYAVWTLNLPDTPAALETVFCAHNVQSCPDGTYVYRIPPSCNFAPCPVSNFRYNSRQQ